MAAFSQFGSDLDTATQEQLANGDRQTEMLKQGQYSPLSMEEQVVSIFSATPARSRDSWIRALELKDISRYQREMLEYIHADYSEILETVASTGLLEDDVEQKLSAALDEFANVFQPSRGPGGLQSGKEGGQKGREGGRAEAAA
jgi:F-type H+-transporting ATPase subunit alpha